MLFGKPKESALDRKLADTHEQNKRASDELAAAVERVLAASRGTVAVFEAIDLANRRKAASR